MTETVKTMGGAGPARQIGSSPLGTLSLRNDVESKWRSLLAAERMNLLWRDRSRLGMSHV